MKSQGIVWSLVAAALGLLLVSDQLGLLLIVAPVSLLASYLATRSDQRKIWNRR
jgi:hypothetical protein